MKQRSTVLGPWPFPFLIVVTLMVVGTLLRESRGDDYIIIQSTTSTQNSGLFDFLLPKFYGETGIQVRVVAVGTGQALKNGRNGDGDVLLVHSTIDEEIFVAEGWGSYRKDVMYNEFVIVGPPEDPASVRGIVNARNAFQRLADSGVIFLSRGDESGTHKKEMALWTALGLEPDRTGALWYREAGAGMGATLNIAVEMRAYTLTDRGTWISFLNKNDFEVLVADDPELFNQYGVIPVDPKKHPSVRNKRAEIFVQWITGPVGQKWIEEYRIDGRQLFFPNAAEG